MPSEEILARARVWRDHDPDPDTRAELDTLIATCSGELTERFAGPLAFGTAGLRGILGAGESRMNRAVVRKTTAGLARDLMERVPRATERGVVVGYDGRRQSDAFAADTAGVLAAAGFRVLLAEHPCPTPIVAFAVRDLSAAGGVMITASHNPPEYNGYKAYADNGAQIIPPADGRIARAIAETGHADAIAVADMGNVRIERFGQPLERRYLDALADLVPAGGDRSLRVVYTALHGVGNELFLEAMRDAAFSDVASVPQQAEPDGAFPTVGFPNPEEPGALDLAFDLARARDAALVLANDPDADRLAAAVRTAPGQYQQLTGNDVGILLGHDLLHRSDAGERRLVIATIVSSPLLGTIARREGARYCETLTGFKWIANKAMELEGAGAEFLFGYEEALGYSVGTLVRDKDGIGAAVVLAALAARLHANGETLLDELTRIAAKYGVYTSAQRSLQFPGVQGAKAMAAWMARLRAAPPRALAGHAVTAVGDCLTGERRQGDAVTPLDLPRSDVIVLELDGGHRVIARPSGTEPKLKLYFDVREVLAPGELLESARARARAKAGELEADVLRSTQAAVTSITGVG